MLLPSSDWSVSTASNDSRDRLIAFWLSAPSDQLQYLWSLEFGSATKKLVKSLSSSYQFTPEQIAIRNSIGQRFDDDGLQHPLAPQLMIVNFLLSPPGLLTINNVDTFFPHWLVQAYHELYGSRDHKNVLSIPPVTQQVSSPVSAHVSDLPPQPDFGSFPETLSLLIDNRIHLNRLLGLSNLYYIDPEDQEICSELKVVRTALAAAINNSDESQLERFWSTDLGDRYWSLVRSGIQKEPLSDLDLSIKADSARRLNPDLNGGFGKPGSINAFLIAMMYFLPGTMQVADPNRQIPSWLLESYKQIFASTSNPL